MATITNPFSYFADGTTGRPLSNGFLYFGQPDTDPTVEANQVTVRSIGSGGVVTEIDQPIRTNESGVVVAPGTMTPFILDLEETVYSVEFQNSQQVAVYTSARTSSSLPSTTGEAGKFLFTDGTNISWESVLPDQAGQAGRFLTTDGTNPSWSIVLPDQSGQAGNYLTTDGTNPSWGEGVPDQSGQAGNYLTTDGTNSSWSPLGVSGATALSFNDQFSTTVTVISPPSGRLLAWSNIVTNRGGDIANFTARLSDGTTETTTTAKNGNNSQVGANCSLIVNVSPGTSVTFTSDIVNTSGLTPVSNNLWCMPA